MHSVHYNFLLLYRSQGFSGHITDSDDEKSPEISAREKERREWFKEQREAKAAGNRPIPHQKYSKIGKKPKKI